MGHIKTSSVVTKNWSFKNDFTLGVVSFILGAALFVFSDTLFGESELTSYAMVVGFILFFCGVIFLMAGTVRWLTFYVKKVLRKN